MTTPLHPLRNKLQLMLMRYKQKWHTLQEKIHRFLAPLSQNEDKDWPSLDELTLAPIEEGTTMAAAHWPLDDNHSKIEAHKMVVVEVKYYPSDPYHTQRMTENDDPNLRITHYPPSNRLH
ncbi:hypothetical protein [Candidatus Berkiella aquae]|uniref:Uncharacterized protein n=1 Tax=Candidatus Berkiella aquae TaxID=295108 RepID=A0A0Q9YMG7_9GAMM|nr:hypothetical protein [Candidatus Berkiella aquae]MCS5710362.1 hypothetical protein [Candidatus Berkiella aquae]